MTPTKILVTGATGFIGTRLCELLKLQWRLPYRALVRNYTRAARIARLDAEMVPGDLGDLETIVKALDGCDTVVHLAHGEDDRAPMETANVVGAALRMKVKRFVHISSMAVHGSNPGPECAREATARLVTRDEGGYPVSKAKQERLVQHAIDRDGLPGIILRPTVVIGPYGGFAVAPVQMAKTGVLSLLDDGKWPCNFVMVDDVCSAIHAAITKDTGLGKAYFVNGDRAVTWRDFNFTFGRMANPNVETVSFDSAELRAYWAKQKPTLKTNLTAAAKLVLSPELHRQLGNVPFVKSTITWAKQALRARVDDEKVLLLKSRLNARSRATGPVPHPAASRILREVFPLEFSNELLKQTLDWKPAYDFARAAEVTRRWLEFARLIPASDASAVSARHR
jgi:nucleoside-diphosphate-sugar epimerase